MLTLTAPLEPYTQRRVVVGVSGGADSVGLLRALLTAGAEPHAVHLDHALRAESAEDAAWVQALCRGLGVPCTAQRVDVGRVAAQRGWNLEEAGRRLRYDLLGRTARQVGAEAVLTAHTRRDQAETVLMEVLRGEGRVRGIAPVWGRVQRPWLRVPREDIERWLHELGQPWREDASNADPRFTRAWLRSAVMPLLRERFPAVEETLARAAELWREDDDALEALAASVTAHAPAQALAPAVRRRWLARQLRAAGVPFGVQHLQALSEAAGLGHTAHLTLPGQRDVTVTAGRLSLGGEPSAWPAPDFPFPPDWVQRSRRPGDRIRLSGGTRKLSDVLTDRRIPRAERDRVPLLVRTEQDGTETVQWVGLRPPVWAIGARESLGVPPDPLHEAMGEALGLARQAAARQEVPVGAVVLDRSGRIIGRGRNTSREDGDMTRHAELAALREAAQAAGEYLTGCTLVVTLEPCPMCLGAALEARVGKIVYGARNPRAGALGGVSDLLAHSWGWQPEVQGGVRAEEAARLLREVFREVRQQKREGGAPPR